MLLHSLTLWISSRSERKCVHTTASQRTHQTTTAFSMYKSRVEMTYSLQQVLSLNINNVRRRRCSVRITDACTVVVHITFLMSYKFVAVAEQTTSIRNRTKHPHLTHPKRLVLQTIHFRASLLHNSLAVTVPIIRNSVIISNEVIAQCSTNIHRN